MSSKLTIVISSYHYYLYISYYYDLGFRSRSSTICSLSLRLSLGPVFYVLFVILRRFNVKNEVVKMGPVDLWKRDHSVFTIGWLIEAVSRPSRVWLAACRLCSQWACRFSLDPVNDNSGTPAHTACSAKKEA